MLTLNRTDTRIATVLKDENGVIITTMKTCGMVNEFDMMDLNMVIRQLAGDQPPLKLMDARASFDLSKKARELAEKEEELSGTKARAIVVSNSIKAGVLNFLKEFNNRDYPNQFFNDKDEAYRWLLTFKADKHKDLYF